VSCISTYKYNNSNVGGEYLDPLYPYLRERIGKRAERVMGGHWVKVNTFFC